MSALSKCKQEVSEAEKSFEALRARLADAEGTARRHAEALPESDDVERDVEAVARAKAQADVLSGAVTTAKANLDLALRALAEAEAAAAREEAAALAAEYRKADSESWAEVSKVAVGAILPRVFELAALGSQVQEAVRRGGSRLIYPVEGDPSILARMMAARIQEAVILRCREVIQARVRAGKERH